MALNVRLPRVINPTTGEEISRIRPISASVNLTLIPLSSAHLELQKGDTIEPRSYVEMYTANGSAGIFRARAPQYGYGDEWNIVELEHSIAEVGDYLIKTPIDEQQTTLANAISILFGHYTGTLWALGRNSATDSVVLSSGMDDVLTAMLDILEQTPQYMMTFDQSVYPWEINIDLKPTTVMAEGRLARNLESVQLTYDDSELCTRVYMEGLPKASGETIGHLDSDTIGTYGIVEREIPGSEDITAAQATRAATLYLEKHKRPKLSVEISGTDLSQITGESFDQFSVGKLCRIALPDDGITVEETIVSVNYGDVYGDPESVTVTLSEEPDTLVTFLHKQAKTGGGSGGGLKQEITNEFKKYETKFEKTDKYFSLLATESEWDELKGEGHVTAYTQILSNSRSINLIADAEDLENAELHNKSLIKVAGDGINLASETANKAGEILRKAGLSVDQQGVLIYATDDPNYIGAKLQVTPEGLESRLQNAEGAISLLQQNEESIRTSVSHKNRVFTMYSDPTLTEDVQDNDIWIKAAGINAWGDVTETVWGDVSTYEWRETAGSETYYYRNGTWHLWNDHGGAILQGTRIEQTEDHIALQAADLNGQYAELKVESDRIRSYVTDVSKSAHSMIEQTATKIRSEVWDDSDQDHSTITQTKNSIMLEVGKKARVWKQKADPTTPAGGSNTPNVGDKWLQTLGIYSYSDATEMSWDGIAGNPYKLVAGATEWFWTGTAWQKVSDYGSAIINGTRIEQERDHIALIADDMEKGNAMLRVESDHIYSQVIDRQRGLKSRIDQTADRVSIVVDDTTGKIKAAQIVASINERTGTSNILISADQVDLDGYVTADTINADYIVTKLASASSVGITNLTAESIKVRGAGTAYFNLSNMFVGAYISLSGNTYTLNLQKLDSTMYTPPSGYSLTFSRATSLTGSWSGGTLTVTANPQGNTYKELITQTSINGTPTLNANNSKYVDAVVDVYAKTQGASGNGNVVFSSTKTVNATAAYNAGAKKSGSWSGGTYTVVTDPSSTSTTVSTTLSDSLTLTGSPTYSTTDKTLTQNASVTTTTGTTVKSYAVELDATAAYNAGYTVTKSDITVTKSTYTNDPGTVDQTMATVYGTGQWIKFWVKVHGTTMTLKLYIGAA